MVSVFYFSYLNTLRIFKGRISKRRINNIVTQCQLEDKSYPLIKYTVSPDSLEVKYADKVTVSATSDGDNLQYSTDGVVYNDYMGNILVTENKRIYFKDTNEFSIFN